MSKFNRLSILIFLCLLGCTINSDTQIIRIEFEYTTITNGHVEQILEGKKTYKEYVPLKSYFKLKSGKQGHEEIIYVTQDFKKKLVPFNSYKEDDLSMTIESIDPISNEKYTFFIFFREYRMFVRYSINDKQYEAVHKFSHKTMTVK